MHKTYIILALNLLFITNLKSYVGGKTLNFNVGKDMLANNIMAAAEQLNLTVGETLKGTGRFESPNINIKVKHFEFTGTIHCDNECNIIAKEPFDENIFKKSGNGKFIIKIDPDMDLNKPNEIEDLFKSLKDSFPKRNAGNNLFSDQISKMREDTLEKIKNNNNKTESNLSKPKEHWSVSFSTFKPLIIMWATIAVISAAITYSIQ